MLALTSAPVHAASPSPAASCPPGIGVGLLQFPSERADDPRARSYVIDHVAPGATFARRFQVCNGTPSTVTASLYAAAATVEDGSFAPATGREANPLSRAISIEPSTITLGPGQAGPATATFRVPSDAAAGEQYAVLFAELAGVPGSPVTTTSRAGIRVYLDIGAGGEKPSDFRVDTLQAGRDASGKPVVTAVVTNTGARALDLRGDLRLAEGPGGLSAGPFAATLGTTLGVGDSQPVTVVLPKEITGGPWTARLTLVSGVLERRVEGRITFPEGAGQQAAPVRAVELSLAEDPSFVIPVASALLGLVALLLLLVLYRRRRKGDDEDERAAEISPS